MKNKKTLLLFLLLIGFMVYTTSMISAWLTDTKSTEPAVMIVGDIEYEWLGEITEDTPIVPGQELVGQTFALKNTSTVTSEIRVLMNIQVKKQDVGAEYIDWLDAYSIDASNPIESPAKLFITFGSKWIKQANAFTRVVSGTTYNVHEYRYDEVVDPYDSANPADPIEVITSMILNGWTVGNEYENAEFKVTLVFEAKQEEYVTWEQLGTAEIDFTTGLASN